MSTALSIDLPALCERAIVAAQQAGAIIQKYRNQPVTIQHKPGFSSEASQVVTEIDHAAQQIIIETLRATIADNDLALLSEELPDDGLRLQKKAFWCIDPLDGTLAFTRRTEGCSVSIALVSRSGKALLGVVFDPDTGDTYHAINGCGAFRNGEVLSPPTVDTRQPLVMLADPSFARHARRSQTELQFQAMARELGFTGARIDYQIGAVKKAMRLLDNTNLCYFKYPRSDNRGGNLWDYAATSCLLTEAGLIACDMLGSPFELNRAESTAMEHRGIIFCASSTIARQIMALNTRLAASS